MRNNTLMVMLLLCSPIVLCFGQWQAMGPPGGSFRALAIAPSNENIIYLASSNYPSSIWKSTDGGNNWSRVGGINYYVYSLSVDPTNPNIVFAGGIYIYRSTDGGVTWTQLTLPSNHYYIYTVKVHPTTPTTILASCYIYANSYYHMGFLKSTNSGTNWVSETLSADTGYAYAMAVDPSNPNNIYVGGYRCISGSYVPTIYKSTDGGSNFTTFYTLPSSSYYVYSLAVHETNSNYVYAGTMYGIYRSTDAGATWTMTSTSSYYYNYSLTTTPANTNLIYAGGNGYVHRSTDAGSTWTMISNGLAGSTFYGVVASRTNSARAYATNNTDFYVSTNTGAEWIAAHNGLNASPITAMAVAPSSQSTIYVDNEGVSMYKTTNSGNTWIKLNKPLACGSVSDIAVYNNDPNTLVALEGSG